MGIKLPVSTMSDHDVEQWLSECYCLVGDEVLKYEGQVPGSRRIKKVALMDGNGEIGEYALSRVECFWPICGAVNVTHQGVSFAVYVARNVRRQWRRSLCGRCVQISIPCSTSVQQALPDANISYWARMRHDVATALYKREFPSAQGAKELILSGAAVSVAVSPQVVLVGDGKGKYLVAYRDEVVAGIDGDRYMPIKKGYRSERARRTLKEIIA